VTKRHILITLAAVATAGCAGRASPPSGAPLRDGATSPEIRAEDLRRRVEILADDSLRGRDSGLGGGRPARHDPEADSGAQRPDLPPFFLISAAEAERLLGEPLAGARQPRTGLGDLHFTLRQEVAPVDAWNVVAVLPGGEARRGDEFVALEAHYDLNLGTYFYPFATLSTPAIRRSTSSGVLYGARPTRTTPPVSRRPSRSITVDA
jgi:hypothetical protein